MRVTDKKEIHASITMKPTRSSEIVITYKYKLMIKKEEDGTLSAFIPGFQLFLYGKDLQELHDKGKSMILAFFNHFFVYSKESSIRGLITQLSRRGFITMPTVMQSLLRNLAVQASLTAEAKELPEYYTEQKEVEGQLQAAL